MTLEEPIVHCYSGHTYAQEPQSFEWQGQRYVVARTESMRRALGSESGVVVAEFTVTTDAGQRFRLSYEAQTDRWAIEPVERS